MSTPKHDIIDDYLLDINIPRDGNIPLEVYIAFPKSLTDKEERERIRKEWIYGNDKQVVAMDLMFKDEMSAIFRPTGILIDWRGMTISVYTPSQLQIIIPNQQLEALGNSTEERVQNLNDYLYVKFRKRERALVADLVIPLRGKVEEGIAKEILNNTNYTTLEVILMGLGYKPHPAVKRLFTPRIISWFKGFDGKPLHVAQFTLPETAKTSFGLRCETLFNWKYIPEPPTLARLILDARQGILGEVFLRNGIVFDEFDKWDLGSPDRRYTFDSILTGMEQGKWERGVSALGVRVPDVPRLIPLVFFGNLGDFAKVYGVTKYCVRAWFTQIFTARFQHDVSALADRIAVIDACFKRIPIMDYLTYKVLPDSVIRGIVKVLQEDVKPCNVSNLKGRLKRHADNLYAVMSTFTKVTPELVDSIVSGTFEWDKIIEQLPQQKEEKLPERR
ncbi:MAG: hypothetical protein DRO23_09800 [Thermoprotei archaeon]|nr:MAG: hypothetical protein DRO23_09800 [Thermoprotei archaeon]